ncbi:MAG: hypothetical protein AAFX90_19155 [Pseudomonadota bacterium]
MSDPSNILNSVMLVAAGGVVGMVTGVLTNTTSKWLQSRKEIKDLKAKSYFERQVNSIEAVSDCLIKTMLYAHFRLSELSPNEHYVFSQVMDEAEITSLQKKHMELERVRILESLYLPKRIEDRLSELSFSLSNLKNIEFHDLGEDEEKFKIAGYEGVLRETQAAIEDLKKYVREDYVGINE